jgi:putative transposase
MAAEGVVSHNYYSEINLHVTWHCKDSLPLLTPRVEPLVHRCVRGRIVDTPGVYVHEIGGTDTHIHVAMTIPPTLGIAEFIGQLKGASSHEANQRLGLRGSVLTWQAGYGVVTFGTRDLEWVKQYIQDQREHHASGRTNDRLERITTPESLEESGGAP